MYTISNIFTCDNGKEEFLKKLNFKLSIGDFIEHKGKIYKVVKCMYTTDYCTTGDVYCAERIDQTYLFNKHGRKHYADYNKRFIGEEVG